MDLLRNTMSGIKTVDGALMEKAQKRLNNLTKPRGSLGRLEELAKQIVGIIGNENPPMENKSIFTLAGDHGIAADGVSAFPQEVTPQMVYNFIGGGAGINVLARHVGARVVIADMGVACDLKEHPGLIIKKVAYGTKNFTKGPAMTKEEAVRSIEAGIELFDDEYAKGLDIAGTGDMGIGNTTPSSAIVAVITGKKVTDVTGRGTGVNDAAYRHKIAKIEEGININKPDPKDALDILSKVGGFEIGGIAGIILAASAKKVPVVIDGFISGAAALLACQLEHRVKEYLIAAHCSVEKGHTAILNHIGLKPLLDFDLRLGEGTGAALGISIAEASVKILTEMATFQSAAVSEKSADHCAKETI